MENGNRNFITQLIAMIIILIVGIPVIVGLSAILLMGLIILFGLLFVSIALTSAPFIAGVEPAVAQLIAGIPLETVTFFGVGFICLTIFLFTVYMFLVKSVFLFLIDMVKRILGVEVRHGKNW